MLSLAWLMACRGRQKEETVRGVRTAELRRQSLELIAFMHSNFKHLQWLETLKERHKKKQRRETKQKKNRRRQTNADRKETGKETLRLKHKADK